MKMIKLTLSVQGDIRHLVLVYLRPYKVSIQQVGNTRPRGRQWRAAWLVSAASEEKVSIFQGKSG